MFKKVFIAGFIGLITSPGFAATTSDKIFERVAARQCEAKMTALQARAESGDARSQDDLGDAYFRGLCGSSMQSYAQALTWFQKSADQGYPPGQRRLGLMYRYGYGGLGRNLPEAVRLNELAALQGDSFAQYNLGWFYKEGIGVKQDPTVAEAWFKLAAAQGNKAAQQQLGQSNAVNAAIVGAIVLGLVGLARSS